MRNRKQTIKQLAKNECANFDLNFNNIGNYYSKEHNPEKKCSFFIDDKLPKCLYFEKGVLPLNPELEVIYYKERTEGKELSHYDKQKVLKDIDDSKNHIECKKCGEDTIVTSNRQKYCEKCSKDIKRERQSKLMQDKRKKY